MGKQTQTGNYVPGIVEGKAAFKDKSTGKGMCQHEVSQVKQERSELSIEPAAQEYATSPQAEQHTPSQETPTPSTYWLTKRYEVLEQIGAGGMGKVFRVMDHKLDTVIALKVLLPSLTDNPKALSRFTEEVRLARQVTDRHIARTFDIGEHDGLYFITMEYIEGESLTQLLTRRGRLDKAECIDIGLQLCKGLIAAHEADITHRDLKPDNILIEKGGRVVITDFGIAQQQTQHDKQSQTSEKSVIGTPAYMAPEQFTKQHPIDARTDLYALGAILFEIFTGSRAWVGDDPLVLMSTRITAPPPDPKERCKDIDEAVAALLQRCMAKEPQDRYPNTQTLLQALKALQSDEENTLSPPLTLAHGELSLQPPPSTSAQHIKALAVLSFRNEGCKDDIYLIEGVCEDLIDTLSMFRDCKLCSWSKSSQLPSPTLEEVQSQLGADYVVTGSFRRIGEHVQLRVRLTSCLDGFQLWSKRFRSTTAELFDLVDEIAAELGRVLIVKQPTRVQEQYHTQDPVAIDLYFRAKKVLRECWHNNISLAVEQFEKARHRAPNDPLILSGTAIARARHAFFKRVHNPQLLIGARLLAEQAVQFAPERAEALFAMGLVCYLEGMCGDALKWLEKALTVCPTNADAHDLFGRIHLELSDIQKGMKHLKLAFSLDPNIRSAGWDLIRGHALCKNWDALETQLAQPFTNREPQIREISLYRARLWQRNFKTLPAQQEYTRPLVEFSIMRYRYFAGQPREDEDFRKLDTPPSEKPIPNPLIILLYQQSAEICAHFGKETYCFLWIQKAYEQGLTDFNWLRYCVLFDPFREHPTFQSLLAMMETRARTLLQQEKE